MNAHSAVHLNVGLVDAAELLRCDHPDGRVSFRLVDSKTQVWLTGTAENFDLFADAIDTMASRIRTEEPSCPGS